MVTEQKMFLTVHNILQDNHSARLFLTQHRAPEQTDAEFGPRGTHTDVWGFASTVIHLATGQLPYSGLTPLQILGAMLRRRPPAVADTLPAWLQQNLQQCLSFDVAARPSLLQLLQVSL